MRPLILPPLLLLATPVLAQESPSHVETEAEGESRKGDATVAGTEILVIATRIRGQVDAPQPPLVTLDEADIASYGASTIEDLVTAISPQTGSGRGRGDGHPVILLNGQRVSSFRELRNIPPEAIRRLEVLPEEVALRFGYPPDQRVINFILKDNYASKTVAGEYNVPTHGGFADSELEGGLLRINGPRRLNIEAKLTDTTMLTEVERGVRQAPENVPTVASDRDPAAYRSLIDTNRERMFNATWTTGLGEEGLGGNLSINGGITRIETRSLAGLDTVRLTAPDGATALRSLGDPLRHVTDITAYAAGLTLNTPLGNKQLGRWLLTATLDASHSDTNTRVDRKADTSSLVAAAAAGSLAVDAVLPALPSPASDRTQAAEDALISLVTVAGAPAHLPAGDVSLTLKGGFDYYATDNRDTRTAMPSKLDRGDLSIGANIALPITSRRQGVLGGIGDVSLNFSAGLDHLSDFGTLADWSAGMTWSPTEKLGIQASYIVNEAAPSLGQLGNPQVLSFNVPVFDFTRGETALVTTVSGGNPSLLREKQRDLKLSANWELPLLKRSNLIVEYFRNRSSDVTQSFPLLTPEIEAAFPGRAVRNASGALVAIDRRPVTFSEVESSRLRWGLNLSGGIGKPREEKGGEPGGPSRIMRRGDGEGRWNLSFYHTYRFSETVTVAPGGPVLNLLEGDALADGGTARHALELEGGLFHKGFGLRLEGEWQAPVHVRSRNGSSTSDLRFGSTFVLDVRLFVNFEQQESLVAKAPFLKGTRLAVQFDNIFDSRQKVTDSNGTVPLNYQADYRDPRGRVIGIDLRKMF